MKVKSESEVAQSYPTPSDPMDRSLPGPSIHGIFQARVLEWVAIAFSVTGNRSCLLEASSQKLRGDSKPNLCSPCLVPKEHFTHMLGLFEL